MKMRPATEKKDGIILPGATKFARNLGLSVDKFTPKTYLWKRGSEVYISFIESKNPGQGDFRALIRNLLNRGYTVKIPTPLFRMEQIVQDAGYQKMVEHNHVGDPVEVWVKQPEEGIIIE